MPTRQEDTHHAAQNREERRELRAVIGKQVLDALGQPGDLLGMQVRPLWQDHYRVNVFVGVDAASAKIAHSYFLVVNSDDSPILIERKSIMVALSPRLLLEIDRTKNNIPHDCCVSNFLPPGKLEEFRRRSIASTFREIIFSNPTVLEEWRCTPEFVARHALMANLKSYNAVVSRYADREIWKINAYSDGDESGDETVVTGACSVLIHAGAPREATAANMVRIDSWTLFRWQRLTLAST